MRVRAASSETTNGKTDHASDSVERAHDDYSVGWVCALPKEQTAATAMLDQRHADLPQPRNDPNTYTLGSVGRHNVVIACLPKGQVGTNSAAIVASRMVSTFPSIRFGLLVGIGGGVPPRVRLGDVVVSTPVAQFPGVVQWDFGKAVAGGKFERTGSLNSPPTLLLTALSKLETEHELSGSKIPEYLEELRERWPRLAPKYLRSDALEDTLFRADYDHVSTSAADDGDVLAFDEEEEESCQFCDKTKVVKRKPRDLRLHYGVIASGNQVVKDAVFRDRLNADLGGKILCIEMEAAGLMSNFPCVVIRGICDYADSHKNKAWQEHAAAVSAAFAKELLAYIQPGEVARERSARDILDKLLDHTEALRSRLDEEEDVEILNWLTSAEYGLQQSDYIRRREAGTCQWLLDSPEYRQWLEAKKQTLFCPGIPGAGKTMFTAVVIDDLTARFRRSADVGIAYIYCDFRRRDEQRAEDLLASLLKQLCRERSSLPAVVEALYDEHKKTRTRPSLVELSKALQSVVAMYSRVFIIVDALDECQVSDGYNSCRARLLTTIKNLQAQSGANALATSRFIPEIVEVFEGSTLLEIRATAEDLQRYVDGHMFELPGFVGRSLALQAEIRTGIVQSVQGMFLLAQLHLNSLIGKRSTTAIRNALARLPDGSDAYDRAYEDAMERIGRQSANQKDLARQVLLWIANARRPLTTPELQDALAVKVGESELDRDNVPQVDDMISVCAGLVTVATESNVVRFIHYTTQQYFERTQSRWFPEAEADIAGTCVSYLSFGSFQAGHCPTDEELSERLRLNPLYDYAARNWGYHARAAPEEASGLVLNLLRSPALVSASYQAMTALRGCSYVAPEQITAAHLVAHFDLVVAMAALLKSGHDPDAKDGYGQTPLSRAAENGSVGVVKLLLRESRVDPDSRDDDGQTPLSYAAENGHERAVKLLLGTDGVDPDAKSTEHQRTPLSWAAQNGHEPVVKLLLAESGVNPNHAESYGYRTPLSLAAEEGHERVVRLLLAKDGVDPDPKDLNGQTPLSWAAENGHEKVVELLITADGVDANSEAIGVVRSAGDFWACAGAPQKAGVDWTSKGQDGQSPLSWAAANGHEAVVKLLLVEDDVDPDCKDRYGRTPLSRAAQYGHEGVVRALLQDGRPDPHSRDCCFDGHQTPLSWAAENGHEAVVALLLAQSETDLDQEDARGRTPLSWAAKNGHDTVAKLLLERGADPDTKDSKNETPLSKAAKKGCEAVVRLLLGTGKVDPDSRAAGSSSSGRTPLSYAAENGSQAVVQLLLDTGKVEPDLKDGGGRTPLLYAAEAGNEEVAKQLLAVEAVDPDSKDQGGGTPLLFAAGNGHEAIVRHLLSTGTANPDSRASSLWIRRSSSWSSVTPLLFAARYGHQAVVSLLLGTGMVDWNSKDCRGRTPLSHAAENGHASIVKLLLEEGAEPDLGDSNGRTPLAWAAGDGSEEVVRMLLRSGAVEPNSTDDGGATPLLWAAGRGCYSIAAEKSRNIVIDLLLSTGKVDVESKDSDGRSALSYAAERGYATVSVLLLTKDGVDADSKATGPYNGGRTPLSYAAGRGSEAIVQLLLRTGRAEADSEDGNGRTPLSWAATEGREAVTKVLLADDRVNPNSKNKKGRTPLSLAAENEHKAVTKVLLANDRVDPNSRDNQGQTPLLRAVKKSSDRWRYRYFPEGYETVVELLLSCNRVDPDPRDSTGRTPLSWAAEKELEAATKLLLAADKTDVDSEDSNGRTPLSYAAEYNRREDTAKLLLDRGANVEAKDENGRTPLSYAAQKGDEKVAKLLLDTSANVETEDKNGRTPLSYAAEHNWRENTAKLLLDRGANVEAKDENGRTPLSYAAQKWTADIAKVLLDRGAKVKSKDKDGLSPLSRAIENGCESIIQLLSDSSDNSGSKEIPGEITAEI